MMKKIILKVIFFFVYISLAQYFNLPGSSAAIAAHTQREWTIIVFIAADNNLHDAGLDDINEMESGLYNVDDAYVIVLFDGSGDKNTFIYNVKYDFDTNYITSPTIPLSEVDTSWSDELNTGDGMVFEKFVSWAIEEYPSNKVAVILWNHGWGALWKRVAIGENDNDLGGPFKGICEDTTSHDRLRMNELRTAIINIYNNIGQ